MKAIWQKNTPYSQFLISVGVILLSAVLFTVISMVVGTAVYGLRMSELEGILGNMNDPAALPIFKMVQTVFAIGAFVIPPFVIAYLFSMRPMEYLSLDKSSKAVTYVLIVALVLVITPLINFLGELNSHMHLPGFLKNVEEWMKASEEKAAVLTELFLKMDNTTDLIINLFMIALIPAIGEELLFRGIVQRIFGTWSKNVHIGVWTAAFLFSAMHMQFYGFIPRFLLGGLLGYLLVWSGNLWLPITAHFVNNAGAVIFAYLFQHGHIAVDPDKIGVESDFGSVAISLALGVILFWLIWKRESTNSPKENYSVEETFK